MAGSVIQPSDLVEAGLYRTEQDVIESALAHLLADRPELRIEIAIHRYETGELDSIGAAAELAGVTRWEFLDMLDARGIESRLAPATLDEARREVATLDRYLRAHPD